MINEKLTNYQLKNISSNKTNNILFEEFECGKLYNTKNETTDSFRASFYFNCNCPSGTFLLLSIFFRQ